MIAAIGGSAYTLATAPLLPWWAIGALAGAAVLLLAFGLWRRAGAAPDAATQRDSTRCGVRRHRRRRQSRS